MASGGLIHPSGGTLKVNNTNNGLIVRIVVLDKNGALVRRRLGLVLLPKGVEVPVALERGLGSNDLVLRASEGPADEGVALLHRGVVEVVVTLLAVFNLILNLIQDLAAVIVGDGVLLGRRRGLLLLNERRIEIQIAAHRSLGARPGFLCLVVLELRTSVSVEEIGNLVARLLDKGGTLESVGYLFARFSRNHPSERAIRGIKNRDATIIGLIGCALGSRLLDLCSNGGYRRRAKHHAQAQTGRDGSVKLPIHVVVLSRLASSRPLRRRRHLNCIINSSRNNPKLVAQPSYI